MYDYEDDEDDVFGPPPSVTANSHSNVEFANELNADQLIAVTAEDGQLLCLPEQVPANKNPHLPSRLSFTKWCEPGSYLAPYIY